MNLVEIKYLLAQYEDIIELLNRQNSNKNFDLETIFYINNLLKIQVSHSGVYI
jgi:hypothetical protein